jgi:hypothetical protein
VSERPIQPKRAPQATGAERRAWVRYPCERESVCQPYTQEKDELWWPAQIRDISAGGVGLLMTRRFEPGTILSIELATGIESPARQLLVRVKHASTRNGQGWVVGCEFFAPLSDDDLSALR